GVVSSPATRTVSPTTNTTYSVTALTDANCASQSGDRTGSAVVSIKTTIWKITSPATTPAWTNGYPDATTAAIIEASYTSGGSDINACSLTVNSATVVISFGDTVTLSGPLVANVGSFVTFNNNANLIQTGSTYTNSGAIIIKRDSSLLYRLDYTLWSSPVAAQKLFAFSPLTSISPTVRFYTYNTATNVYNSVVGVSAGAASTDVFAIGTGYLIRMPYNWPTYVNSSIQGTAWTGTFTGVPNNGDIQVAVSLLGTPATIGPPPYPDRYGYNAVGNPYPSKINVHNFIDANANISGTLYFWRKTNTTAPSTSYATLTKTAYVANGAAGGDTGAGFFPTSLDGSSEQNWVINIGQGFFVKATSGTTISFTNGMRRSLNTNQFFRNSQTTTTVNNGLYWLNLTDNTGVYSQMAVGYSAEGTLGYDRGIDGENINREFYLTSLIGADEYSIQGRPDFDSSDIVPLSYKAVTAGNYNIAIDHTAGLFTDVSQPIYVKDNLTTTYHDLNTGAYNFATDAGTFNDRFEIVYALPLGIENPIFTANSVIVYNQNNELIINTGSVIMASVKIYDIRGRLLQERKGINASQTSMTAGLANEVLLVQITSEDGEMVTKKVIK
ncbi:hypothetical protein, partial [Flavobacterium sp.]|uniref:hypothetical protein n=1 Tax=Flavobacterium sp. TaxID=239 RepID=UPI00286A1BA3